VNRDPIGYAALDMNLYGYVGQMPTYYVDPLGLKKRTCVCMHPTPGPPSGPDGDKNGDGIDDFEQGAAGRCNQMAKNGCNVIECNSVKECNDKLKNITPPGGCISSLDMSCHGRSDGNMMIVGPVTGRPELPRGDEVNSPGEVGDLFDGLNFCDRSNLDINTCNMGSNSDFMTDLRKSVGNRPKIKVPSGEVHMVWDKQGRCRRQLPKLPKYRGPDGKPNIWVIIPPVR